MWHKTMRAFVEGRGTLASLERAIADSANPLNVRAEIEKELAAEWALKSLYAAIPAPPHGLSRALQVLRAAPAPALKAEHAHELARIGGSVKSALKQIPEPRGGFRAALERLKFKLAAAPMPQLPATEVQDIAPCFDELPARPVLSVVEKKRGSTRKIVPLPRRAPLRDVLAAGKDLPENPDELK